MPEDRPWGSENPLQGARVVTDTASDGTVSRTQRGQDPLEGWIEKKSRSKVRRDQGQG